MELHNLKPAAGSVKTNKRLGRGQGSGSAGTAGRGHKGAKSRSGYSRKRNFEGGQMPLQMRIPKRGFKNPNRTTFVPMNLERLQAINDKYGVTDITPEKLVELGIIKKGDKIKILGDGDISVKFAVTANAVSKSAQDKIAAAGGSINLI